MPLNNMAWRFTLIVVTACMPAIIWEPYLVCSTVTITGPGLTPKGDLKQGHLPINETGTSSLDLVLVALLGVTTHKLATGIATFNGNTYKY